MLTLTSPRFASNGHSAVEPEQPKTLTKVAIVGKAPSSLGMAPYLDPEWSIWGLSDLWKMMQRPVNQNDRWFELHDLHTGRKGDNAISRGQWPPEYFEWLNQHQDKLPLYLGHRLRIDPEAVADLTLEECRAMDAETKQHPMLPKARMYPVYEVLKRFGTYFNNSISFMIALAIMEQATHISVYGVDMAQSDPLTGKNGEYEHQRPSCEYMLGFARGAGIEVHVPGEADLLKCRKIYAFQTHGNESDEERKRIARAKELRQRIAQNDQQAQQCQLNSFALKGALDQMDYDLRRSR